MFGKMARPKTPAVSFGDSSVADTAPCQKTLKLRVKAEAIRPVREAVVAEFQREAALPGFRKGKAPADLIERQYGKSIQDETLQRITKATLEETAKTHELKPVGPFEVRAVSFSPAGELAFEATVEVEPVFELGPYKGIAVPEGSDAVASQELEEALKSLQESSAQLVPGAEGQPKERHVPPLDDELAKDVGLKDLAALKEHVEAKLREQKRAASARAKEAALSEELLKRHAFSVPPRLVDHQTERLTRDFTVRLLFSGVAEEQAKQETAKFTEQLRQAGERHVKLSFIIDRIAEQEQVAVTQQELVERLWQLARGWKKDPAEVRAILDAQGLWPSVYSAIRQEKTMSLLLAAAVVTNGSAQSTTSSKAS
ncbi:MAG: hypothetical protein HY598_05190 [Candidatus Omnitrophica bacterium]|nr:hypothetical protein [Candidatus Omnitrophota bacterium]